MTRIARHQRWDGQGNLLEEVLEEVSDEQIERDEAPDRLRAIVSTLADWADDSAALDAQWGTLTNAQILARVRVLNRRQGLLARGLRDMLLRWEP